MKRVYYKSITIPMGICGCSNTIINETNLFFFFFNDYAYGCASRIYDFLLQEDD